MAMEQDVKMQNVHQFLTVSERSRQSNINLECVVSKGTKERV